MLYETTWEDSDDLLDSSMLVKLRRDVASQGLGHCDVLLKLIQENYDNLRNSDLYNKSKSARHEILAHKQT